MHLSTCKMTTTQMKLRARRPRLHRLPNNPAVHSATAIWWLQETVTAEEPLLIPSRSLDPHCWHPQQLSAAQLSSGSVGLGTRHSTQYSALPQPGKSPFAFTPCSNSSSERGTGDPCSCSCSTRSVQHTLGKSKSTPGQVPDARDFQL